jgi:hypothetical protein
MEGVDKELLGSFLSRAAKGSLNGGEAKIVFALLKATLVDGNEGIEYNLYNFQLLTDMQKARVDTALGSLLTRKVVRLNKAKNRVVLNKIAITVRQLNSNTQSKQLETTTVSPISFNPVTAFVQGIGRYLPAVKYDGKGMLIERANAKRMYSKFLEKFQTQEAAYGLMQDYLLYKIETDQWFKTNARLPVTYLYKYVDQYLAGIKPKTRDDIAFEKAIGRRLSWDNKSRTWGASKTDGDKT